MRKQVYPDKRDHVHGADCEIAKHPEKFIASVTLEGQRHAKCSADSFRFPALQVRLAD
jgi:hypothetical protein